MSRARAVIGATVVLTVAALTACSSAAPRVPEAAATSSGASAVLSPAASGTAAASAVGTGSRAGPGACGTRPVLRGKGPAAVVILLDGVITKQGGGTWKPLATSPCPVDAHGRTTAWPAGAVDGLRRFSMLSSGKPTGFGAPLTSDECVPGKGFGKGGCLTEEIARSGAIMIPYSYAGTVVKGTGLAAVVAARTYDTQDQRVPLGRPVAALANEIVSIEKAWPAARIILAGHSWGGLIAEQWWERHRGARRDEHVTAVFTLDGAINGVSDCPSVGVGPQATQQCQALYASRYTHDQQISRANGDHTLHVIATASDPAYDGSGDGGLDADGLYRCADHATCKLPPTYLSPCAPFPFDAWGTGGHDQVKACPAVLKQIRAATRAAVLAKGPIT